MNRAAVEAFAPESVCVMTPHATRRKAAERMNGRPGRLKGALSEMAYEKTRPYEKRANALHSSCPPPKKNPVTYGKSGGRHVGNVGV